VTGLPTTRPAARTPDHTKRVRPKTYTVAVYLVAAVVVLQAGMLVYAFWLRAMVVSVNVNPPKGKVVAIAHPLPAPPKPAPVKPPELPALPGLTPTALPAALLSVPSISDKLEQIGTLNDEAQVLLHQNDLKNAAQVLNTAEDLDPRNPTTLKNEAETFYLMNDSVRSKIYWQRLADLGPGVGTVYAVARDHVLLLDSTSDGNPLSQTSTLPRAIYVAQVEKTPVETVNGQPQFHLRTVLMRKNAQLPFDQKLLQPYVIFYQQMPDGSLLPDLRQHKGSFDDTFLFWHDKPKEPFGVDYLMPTPGQIDPGTGAASGDYYGFVIGIYYNKILQDARSEPSDLVRRLPLPEAIE
jgi:hypothetical protein